MLRSSRRSTRQRARSANGTRKRRQVIGEQEKFRKQLANTFSGTPFAPLEEHVRRNMELFQQTFSMFKPFVPPRAGAVAETDKEPEASTAEDNIEDLRRQMKEMQERLERMSPKKDQ